MKDEMLMFKKNALLGNISAEPLCQAYKQAWRACGNDKEMLVRLALKQQSLPYFSHACYSNLGLTKKYILENFADYINGKRVFDDVDGVEGYTYSLYVGFKAIFEAATDVLSLMWCNCPSVTIKASKCPVLYVSNKSSVHLTCEGYNAPRIYLFDESTLTIDDADESCDIVVYKYSSRANVELGKYCLGRVKIFPKELRL